MSEIWIEFEERIQKIFHSVTAKVRNKKINNFIMENLRKSADSPTWVFELFLSYILGYTHPNPSLGYLEEKRKAINKWLKEISEYGYKDKVVTDL